MGTSPTLVREEVKLVGNALELLVIRQVLHDFRRQVGTQGNVEHERGQRLRRWGMLPRLHVRHGSADKVKRKPIPWQGSPKREFPEVCTQGSGYCNARATAQTRRPAGQWPAS